MYPDEWKELFSDLIPKKVEKQNFEPIPLIQSLIKENLKVKDQAQIFQEKTGLSLRTFYSYRKLMETSS